MSEGVTPSRRAAWPTVAGRKRSSRWRGFSAQGAQVDIRQVGRNPVVFHCGGASDLGFLLADVAGVLDLELNVGGGFGRGRIVARQFGNEIAGHAGADQHFQTGRGCRSGASSSWRSR